MQVLAIHRVYTSGIRTLTDDVRALALIVNGGKPVKFTSLIPMAPKIAQNAFMNARARYAA
jgi:hypothetical protein